MRDEDVEELLNLLQAPEPSAETREAVMHRVRVARTLRTTAGTVRATRLFCRWLLPLAAAGIILGVIVWYSVPEAPVPLAEVRSASLWVERKTERKQLGKGESLFSEDEILGETTPALFQLSDGSTVKLKQGARLALRSSRAGERARLQLVQGGIFLRVSKIRGRFIIEGTAQVAVLGTVFGVEEEKGTTAVSVLSGKVALQSAGKVIHLSRGESGAAKEGHAPKMTEVDPDFSLRWARDWTRFKDRPLGDVLDWIEENSSFRFTLSSAQRQEKVTVAIASEPMDEVIDALMITCGMQHRVDGHNVSVDSDQ